MGFIANLKAYFFQRHQRKEEQKKQALNGPQAVHPLSAQCVAILFLADEAKNRQAVEAYRLARKKQGLRTELLGFFAKEVNAAGYSFDQFSVADTSWCGVPKGESVDKFLDRPCDLLLTLGTANHAQLDYLARLKTTKLRVGPHTGLADNPHDVQFFISAGEVNIAEQLRQIDQIFKVTNAPRVSIAV